MSRIRRVFRAGRVHVLARMCDTCIFRPGNLMELCPERVEDMVQQAIRDESTIVCHSTLDTKQACCRGFFDRHKTQPLQIAERLGLVTYQEPPAK